MVATPLTSVAAVPSPARRIPPPSLTTTFTLRLLLLRISDSWCWCCDCNRRFEWFHDSGSWFYDYNMPMRIGRNRLDSSSRLHLFCRLSVGAGYQYSTNELPSSVLWMRCQFKNLTLMWILEPAHIRISIVVISWCQNLNFITKFWSWFWCFLNIVFFFSIDFLIINFFINFSDQPEAPDRPEFPSSDKKIRQSAASISESAWAEPSNNQHQILCLAWDAKRSCFLGSDGSIYSGRPTRLWIAVSLGKHFCLPKGG